MKRRIIALFISIIMVLGLVACGGTGESQTSKDNEEKKSAELLCSRLEAHGFTIERGVAGMETAFTATYGSGSPAIGILAEYDALKERLKSAETLEKPDHALALAAHPFCQCQTGLYRT